MDFGGDFLCFPNLLETPLMDEEVKILTEFCEMMKVRRYKILRTAEEKILCC